MAVLLDIVLGALTANQTQIHYAQPLKVCSDSMGRYPQGLKTNASVSQRIDNLGMGCFGVSFLEEMQGVIQISETDDPGSSITVKVRASNPNVLRLDGIKYQKGTSICHSNAYCDSEADRALNKMILAQKSMSDKTASLTRRQLQSKIGSAATDEQFNGYKLRMENAQFLAAELVYCLSCSKEEIGPMLSVNERGLGPLLDEVKKAFNEIEVELTESQARAAALQLLSVYNEPWFQGFTAPSGFASSVQSQTQISFGENSETTLDPEPYVRAIQSSQYFYRNTISEPGQGGIPQWAMGLIIIAALLVLSVLAYTIKTVCDRRRKMAGWDESSEVAHGPERHIVEEDERTPINAKDDADSAALE